MRITFERTGERRYAVQVSRAERTDLRVDPAPGFSEVIPHDLVHFVVETRLGLRDGIFGQLAAGGNAGMFVPTEEQRTKAWGRQAARRNASTGRDMGASEELAAQVYPRWLRARGHAPGSHYAQVEPPPTELSPQQLDEVFADLDELSARWQAAPVGGCVEVEWPWPERPAKR